MSHAQRGPLASFAALAVVSATLVASNLGGADDRLVAGDDGEVLVQPQVAEESVPRVATPRGITDSTVPAQDSASVFGGAGEPAGGANGRPGRAPDTSAADAPGDAVTPGGRGDSDRGDDRAVRDRPAPQRKRSGGSADPGSVGDADPLPDVGTGNDRDDDRGEQQGPQGPREPEKGAGDRGAAPPPVQKLGSGIWLFLPPLIDGSEDAPHDAGEERTASDAEDERATTDHTRDPSGRDHSEDGDTDRAPAKAPTATEPTTKAPAGAKSGKAKSGKAKKWHRGPGKHRSTTRGVAAPQRTDGRARGGKPAQPEHRGKGHRNGSPHHGSQRGKSGHHGQRGKAHRARR